MFQQQVLCSRETSLNKEGDLNIILNGSSIEGYINVDEIYSMNLYFKACSYFKEQLMEIKWCIANSFYNSNQLLFY